MEKNKINLSKPQVEIVEQPCNARFRYGSEKKLKGLTGIRGASENSFPSIRITNYTGPVKVIISCVTKDPPYKPHPYKLYNGKDNFQHGVCCIREDYSGDDIVFDKLAVECVSKKNMIQSLSERANVKVDPFNTGFKIDFNKIELHCVRLCFQVILESPLYKSVSLDPIVSDPFFNSKGIPGLDICWLTRHSASVAGGTQMCILCEKVSKNDIEVLFYHEASNWEAIGRLTGPSVFKQVAIVIETPEYRTDKLCPESIKEPLQINIQLRRPSDGEVGDPRPFLLLPLKIDRSKNINDEAYSLKRKREKYEKESNALIQNQTLQAEIVKNRDKQLSDVTCELWELPPVPSLMKMPASCKSKQSHLLEPCINISSENSNKHNLLTDAEFIPREIANEITNQLPIDKSTETYGNTDTWMQDLLDVIKDDLDAAQIVLNPTTTNRVTYEPDTNFFTLSLNSSTGVANMINPNINVNSAALQMDQFFHTEFPQGSSYLNDLDNICFSDLIPDINCEFEDFYSNIKDSVGANAAGKRNNQFEKFSDNISKF